MTFFERLYTPLPSVWDICCKYLGILNLPLDVDQEHRMLAVMTLNIGYFLSILGGSFLGDLAVRRYITYDINNED